MKTVHIYEAHTDEGNLLNHWLELDTGTYRVNFRYENFVTEEEKNEIYDVLVNARADTPENVKRWKGVLNILRNYLKEIVTKADKFVKNYSEDDLLEFGTDGFTLVSK